MKKHNLSHADDLKPFSLKIDMALNFIGEAF
jgi:hypothetical protein